MKRDYPILRFPLYRPASAMLVDSTINPSDMVIQTLDFHRGKEFLERTDTHERVPVDVWICSECSHEQWPDCVGVEEFLALHAKKHAYGLIRK